MIVPSYGKEGVIVTPSRENMQPIIVSESEAIIGIPYTSARQLDAETRRRLRVDEPYDDWEEAALCQETDPEAFFPEKGGGIHLARRICNMCIVSKECLDDALDSDEKIWGVRAGMSERQLARRRMDMRKQIGDQSANGDGNEAEKTPLMAS